MPDFTFTSPEGKNYTVTGPEGATKEQAFQILQQRLKAGTAQPEEPSKTPAPAPARATTASERVKNFLDTLPSTNPLLKLQDGKPVPPPSIASAAKSIAGSMVFGGIAGALSPEIVTGLGLAASAIPVVGEVAGPALVEAGAAMRGARLATAAVGALSGATGETAGQVAEASGASKGEANLARLAGGMLTPSAATVAGFVGKPVKLAWDFAQKALGGSADIPKAVEAARENLARMAEAGQPQTAMHAMLQKGVEADRQAADRAADAVMSEAHQRAASIAQSDAGAATRLVDEARTRAEAIRADAAKRANALNKAADNKLATANRVLAQAAPELAKVGQVSELSDIGNTLRQAATAKQGAEIQARNEAYKATVAERDAAVAVKESAGQDVGSTAAMAALKKDLKNRLVGEGGFAKTTDAGIRRVYQQVYDAVNPVNQKLSFEALDQVRRRLGDVIAGNQTAEGYEAIGKQAAQKMYAQISKAQEEFAGPAQKTLQSEYAEASGELTKFASKAGKKLTAVDRLDPERFAGDPKALPKAFFNSQQSVRDAKELTGNPQLVDRLASDYTARSMQGMSAKQASAWVRDNQDWMREIPGLSQRSAAYANKLEQIERVNEKLGQRAALKAKEAEATVSGAVGVAEKERVAGLQRATKAAEGSAAAQQRVLEEGGKAAQAAREERFAPAKGLESILKGGEAPEAIRNLLLHGKPEQTRLAAAHLASQSGGQAVLEQSVRQTMRNMTEGNLRQQWTERIRPMLTDGKMLPPERLKALTDDVERLLSSYKGKDKLSLVQRHIAAAIGTAADPNY